MYTQTQCTTNTGKFWTESHNKSIQRFFHQLCSIFHFLLHFYVTLKKLAFLFSVLKKNFGKKIHFSQKMSKRFGSVPPKLRFGSDIHCIDEVMVSAEWPKNGKFGDTISLYSVFFSKNIDFRLWNKLLALSITVLFKNKL